MDKRENFAELLYSTYFDSICDSSVCEAQMNTLRNWVKTNIPNKLYKYRAPEKRNFDAFRNDELWGGSILSFNDPLECLPYYDLNKITDSIKHEFSLETITPIIKQIASGTPPEIFSKLLTKEHLDKLKEITAHEDSLEILEKNLNQAYAQIIAYINSIMDDLERAFFAEIMQYEITYKISCLSESNSSSLMWGHYADSHKGFCLEYDISSVLQDCHNNCSDNRYCTQFMITPAIAPVIYRPERFDASSAFASMITNHLKDKCGIACDNFYYDLLLPMKTLLTKSSAWSYENEWRLFRKDPNITNHQPLINIQAKAAYIGMKMSEGHKNLIKEICIEKNIPCYQMVPQYFNSSYEIKPIKI